MNRKKIIFMIIIVLLFGLSSIGLTLFKNKMNTEVMAYLTTTRGYSDDEISKIYTQISKAPVVSTTVIFADEESSRYFYRKENGRIYQYSMAPVHGANYGDEKYKHEEK